MNLDHLKIRTRLALGFSAMAVLLAALGACATDRQAAATEPPPTFESRTGVPVLMDLPLIGWLFQHRVTVR